MPIYEFECQSCGHRFEELLKISQSGEKPLCPKCESPNTKKAISGFGTAGDSKGSAGGNSCGFG